MNLKVVLKYSIWVNVTFQAVVKKIPVQAQSLQPLWTKKSNKIHLLFCTAHRGQLWPPVVQTTHHTADSASLHHHTLSSWYYPDDWKDAWEHMQIIISTGTQTWHRFVTKKLFISVSIWVGDVIQCNRDNGFPSHSILSCSMASIIAARASTLLMISFSSSVSSSPGVPPGMFIVHLILLNPKRTHTNTQNRHRVQVTSKVKIRLRQMAKTSKKCLRSARH